MPPKKTGNRLSAGRGRRAAALDRARGRVRPALGLDPARVPAPAEGPRRGLAPQRDRLLDSGPAGERADLKPSPEADPYTLLRRASLDLRGLPPTPEELDRFIQDQAPDAYERAVDRFLDDPAYGERWARMWLDLARYADSAGSRLRPARGPTSGGTATGSSTPSTATSLRSVHPPADRRRPAAELPASRTGSPPPSTATR